MKYNSIDYDHMTRTVNTLGLTNTRIYFNGTNLLTFSKYKHAEPEVNRLGVRGWETPFGKTFTFGIELGFSKKKMKKMKNIKLFLSLFMILGLMICEDFMYVDLSCSEFAATYIKTL